jgi:hypothetical protein
MGDAGNVAEAVPEVGAVAMEKLVHAQGYYASGPCERCGAHTNRDSHVTYRYTKDEKHGVMVMTPELWCEAKCCPLCIAAEKEKGAKT